MARPEATEHATRQAEGKGIETADKPSRGHTRLAKPTFGRWAPKARGRPQQRPANAAESRERQEFAFEAAVRMPDGFLQQELWERLGVPVKEAAGMADQALGSSKSQNG